MSKRKNYFLINGRISKGRVGLVPRYEFKVRNNLTSYKLTEDISTRSTSRRKSSIVNATSDLDTGAKQTVNSGASDAEKYIVAESTKQVLRDERNVGDLTPGEFAKYKLDVNHMSQEEVSKIITISYIEDESVLTYTNKVGSTNKVESKPFDKRIQQVKIADYMENEFRSILTDEKVVKLESITSNIYPKEGYGNVTTTILSKEFLESNTELAKITSANLISVYANNDVSDTIIALNDSGKQVVITIDYNLLSNGKQIDDTSETQPNQFIEDFGYDILTDVNTPGIFLSCNVNDRNPMFAAFPDKADVSGLNDSQIKMEINFRENVTPSMLMKTGASQAWLTRLRETPVSGQYFALITKILSMSLNAVDNYQNLILVNDPRWSEKKYSFSLLDINDKVDKQKIDEIPKTEEYEDTVFIYDNKSLDRECTVAMIKTYFNGTLPYRVAHNGVNEPNLLNMLYIPCTVVFDTYDKVKSITIITTDPAYWNNIMSTLNVQDWFKIKENVAKFGNFIYREIPFIEDFKNADVMLSYIYLLNENKANDLNLPKFNVPRLPYVMNFLTYKSQLETTVDLIKTDIRLIDLLFNIKIFEVKTAIADLLRQILAETKTKIIDSVLQKSRTFEEVRFRLEQMFSSQFNNNAIGNILGYYDAFIQRENLEGLFTTIIDDNLLFDVINGVITFISNLPIIAYKSHNLTCLLSKANGINGNLLRTFCVSVNELVFPSQNNRSFEDTIGLSPALIGSRIRPLDTSELYEFADMYYAPVNSSNINLRTISVTNIYNKPKLEPRLLKFINSSINKPKTSLSSTDADGSGTGELQGRPKKNRSRIVLSTLSNMIKMAYLKNNMFRIREISVNSLASVIKTIFDTCGLPIYVLVDQRTYNLVLYIPDYDEFKLSDTIRSSIARTLTIGLGNTAKITNMPFYTETEGIQEIYENIFFVPVEDMRVTQLITLWDRETGAKVFKFSANKPGEPRVNTIRDDDDFLDRPLGKNSMDDEIFETKLENKPNRSGFLDKEGSQIEIKSKKLEYETDLERYETREIKILRNSIYNNELELYEITSKKEDVITDTLLSCISVGLTESIRITITMQSIKNKYLSVYGEKYNNENDINTTLVRISNLYKSRIFLANSITTEISSFGYGRNIFYISVTKNKYYILRPNPKIPDKLKAYYISNKMRKLQIDYKDILFDLGNRTNSNEQLADRVEELYRAIYSKILSNDKEYYLCARSYIESGACSSMKFGYFISQRKK